MKLAVANAVKAHLIYKDHRILLSSAAAIALGLTASGAFAQNVPRNALMEFGYVETRTCLDQSYKKLLRGGIKNRAALVSRGMVLCRAQISVFAGHMHGTEDENSS